MTANKILMLGTENSELVANMLYLNITIAFVWTSNLVLSVVHGGAFVTVPLPPSITESTAVVHATALYFSVASSLSVK